MQATIVNNQWRGYLGRELAPRELECVMAVAEGLTAKEIARRLGIQPSTVVKRLANAMYKLGVRRQPALVAEAMKRQIISPLCIALVGLLALHPLIGDQSLRRDRHTPHRRAHVVQITRRIETYPHLA